MKQCTDVDLLYIHIGQPLPTDDHPLDVDIRQYSADVVPQRIADSQDVLSWAIRFGQIICERNSYWTVLARTWSQRLPLPNPDVAEQRARRAAKAYQQLLEMGDSDAALEQRVTLLTHLAWARLLRAGVHPASRPELPEQLRAVGDAQLAAELNHLLRARASELRQLVIEQTR
jgi:hypothetical protein